MNNRIAGWLLACGCILAALPLRATAQTGPVELRTTSESELAGRVKEDRWTQRIVQVSNRSGQDRALRVTTAPGGGTSQIFSVTAQVPDNWVRRMHLSLRPGSLGEQPGMDFRIIDPQTGQLVLAPPSNESIVTKLDKDKLTLVVLRQSGELTELNDAKTLKALHGRPLGDLEVVHITGDAPDRWWGYDAADVVILAATDARWLRGTQVQALLDWVGHGGLLVIAAGPRTPQMLAGPLGEAAGVSAVDWHEVGLLQTEHGDVSLETPMPLAELLAVDADVLHRVNGLPLLTRRQYGQGVMMVLALPLTGMADKDLHQYWYGVKRALQLRPSIDASLLTDRSTDLTSPGAKALGSIAGRPAPRPVAPLAILIGLAGLTFAGGLALRHWRRGELLWLGLVPACLIAAAGAWIYGQSRVEQERITALSVMTGSPDGRARIQEMYTYYSGQESRQFDVQSGSPNATIVVLGGRDAMSQTHTANANQMVLTDQAIALDNMKSYAVDGIIRTDGISGVLTFDGDGVQGALTNGLGMSLESAVLLHHERTYALGDLPAGRATAVRIAADVVPRPIEFVRVRGGQAHAEGDFTGRAAVQFDADTRRKQLVSHLMSVPSTSGRQVSQGTWIIGYTDRGLLDPLAGRSLTRRGMGVVAWPVSFAPAPAGEEVAIPFGIAPADVIPQAATSAIWNPSTREFLETTNRADLLLRVTPPAGQRLEAAQVQLRIVLEDGMTLRLNVDGVPGGNIENRQTVPLETRDRPAIETITIDNANRFRNEQGQYVFRIRVGSIDPVVDPTLAANWKFRRIDAALKGQSR